MTFRESTESAPALPWDRAATASPARHPHLVLAWSLDEPDRVGQSIAVEGAISVGRGAPLADDPAQRACLQTMRPAATTTEPWIANARVARVHLLLDRRGTDAVHVRSVGRGAMRINGRITTDHVARAGDVIEIHNAAVFLVVSRPARLPGLRNAHGWHFPFGSADAFGLVGESEAAWALRDALSFAASTDRHVLILGESGTGKELAARAIHGLSRRRAHPLISRNAATLPESLLDAELFGNVRNYPNPGMLERAGLIGEADRSTLLLDEIGDLPERSQSHLLRVLDADGEYQRLGSARPQRSDFRLIAATNRPIESLKHDVLARFTHRIVLPRLDERRDDIGLVVAELLRRVADQQPQLAPRFFERRHGQRAEPRLAPDLVARLLRHSFRHHVRELERLLWLAIASAEGDYIGVTAALDAELNDADEEPTPVSAIDRDGLLRAIETHGTSPTRLAQALGLKNRYVLIRLLKKHDVVLSSDDTGETT